MDEDDSLWCLLKGAAARQKKKTVLGGYGLRMAKLPLTDSRFSPSVYLGGQFNKKC